MPNKQFSLSPLYRNIAIGFSVIAIAVFVFAIYLIWAKVVVEITPAKDLVTHQFSFSIAGDPEQPVDGAISGNVFTVESTFTESYPTTGSRKLDSDSVGEVTIINEYSKEQVLVEETRLASLDEPDKVLVRLRKTVTVPSGAKLKVPVYTDDPDNFQELKPMQFVIPGLWPGLQPHIFAKNEKPLGINRTVSVAQETDFENAKKKLEQKISEQILDNINQELSVEQSLWPRLITDKQSSVQFNAAENDEVSEISGTVNMLATVMVFDENQVIAQAQRDLKQTVSSELNVSVNPKTFNYTVDSFNVENQTANVSASVEAALPGRLQDAWKDKSQLTAKTSEEVYEYYQRFEGINEVKVSFYPAWLKKTPRLSEKIEIKVSD